MPIYIFYRYAAEINIKSHTFLIYEYYIKYNNKNASKCSAVGFNFYYYFYFFYMDIGISFVTVTPQSKGH